MVRCGATLIGLFLPWVAFAQAPVSLHAAYATYAAGLEVANADATISFGPRTYQMSLAYRTTGLVGWFSRGQQFDTVHGTWQGTKAVPARYVGQGTWRGTSRVADIVYPNGQPEIRQLEPPDQADREPVPGSLRANSIDSLSAVVELMRVAGKTGRCDTTVRPMTAGERLRSRRIQSARRSCSRRAAPASPAKRCIAASPGAWWQG